MGAIVDNLEGDTVETAETVACVAKAKSRSIATAELPRKTLEESIAVARPIHDVYAGKSASNEEIATVMGVSPKSPNTRYLIWAAQAYNLIVKEGGNFSLSETGRKILAPNYPAEVAEARLKAITVPTILSRFYSDYNGKLLPDDEFFDNVLQNKYEIPKERTGEAKKIIIKNAEYAGILRNHENGKRTIRLDSAGGTLEPVANGDTQDILHDTCAATEDTGTVDIVSLLGEVSCFYITPIGEEGSDVRRHADMLLRHLIEPAFRSFNINVIRADKIEKSGLISQQIFSHIVNCRFCVADLSFSNPNAFYELGIRHMTKLPTIQIIRKGDRIPFDVSQGRTIIIDMSDIYTIMDKIESASKELVEHIKNCLAAGEKGLSEDNPVSIYLPGLQVKIPKAGE